MCYAQQFSSSLSSSSSQSWSPFCGKITITVAAVAAADQILEQSKSPTGKIGSLAQARTQTRSYLFISLSAQHVNGVDIACLCSLIFFFIFLYLHISPPFLSCKPQVFSYLLYLFCFTFFTEKKKKLFCVLPLKLLVVVGTDRVVGEGEVVIV